MLAVLDLYPYFSKQSQQNFINIFFNDNIYLDLYENNYYLNTQVNSNTVYYFGKYTNPIDAYKIYRNIIVVMSLLGVFKLNKKYLTIDINDLKLVNKYIVYENNDDYKPFVDESAFSTIVILFDGSKHYIQEFCNFNKTLLNTLYESSNLLNIKNNFIKRKERESFETVFWKTYNNKEDIYDSYLLRKAIEQNTGFVTLEEIIEARNEKDEYTNG